MEVFLQQELGIFTWMMDSRSKSWMDGLVLTNLVLYMETFTRHFSRVCRVFSTGDGEQ